MAQQRSKSGPRLRSNRQGITRIHVAGFKSISQERDIEIRPLTILAGANSSGKSSIMQPLLLLKQTLEASYDPGALLLNGPNLKFTSVSQLLSRMGRGKDSKKFYVGVELGPDLTLTTYFKQNGNKRLEVEETIYGLGEEKHRFYMGMEQDEILSVIPVSTKKLFLDLKEDMGSVKDESVKPNIRIVIVRNRCFLTTALSIGDVPIIPTPTYYDAVIANHILQIIHLPGLRGNRERTYPVTAVGSKFPGTFETYVASIIGQWQTNSDNDKLEKVNNDLVRLGLADKVEAKAINDTQVELRINRLIQGNKLSSTKGKLDDMVSIADVGFGVSQALPVVVALHAADEGQLIYLEQPEIHLHPRAQTALAEVLADAAMQGKRMIVETHSSLLLLGIQTMVAEGKLPPELVKLYWFTQQEDGSTQITSADLDETGAYGDWPEDFDTVTLDSEGRYLDAAQARLRGEITNYKIC